MKGNKGQALIEFTLVLPIILFILLYIVEFGRITLNKYQLESKADFIVDLYKDKKYDDINNYLGSNGIVSSYVKKDNFVTLELKQSFKSNLPFINRVIGNSLITKRVIYEKQ